MPEQSEPLLWGVVTVTLWVAAILIGIGLWGDGLHRKGKR